MSISFRASLKISAYQFVTRLLVIQGDFVYVTLAVYGDAALEPPLDQTSYEVTPLPDIFYHRLSPVLDLANSKEPTLLDIRPHTRSAISLGYHPSHILPQASGWRSPPFYGRLSCG